MHEKPKSENDIKDTISFIFQKPLEPIFTKRITKDGKTAILDLPPQYFAPRYADNFAIINSRFSQDINKKIRYDDLDDVPDIAFANEIGFHEQFSLFITRHAEIAGRIISLLMQEKDVEKFLKKSIYIRDRVNAFMFQYAFTVAVSHRSDTSNYEIPVIAEQFPANFIEPSVLGQARAKDAILKDSGQDTIHIIIPRNFTASDREEEQRLAYFREDIAVNMHHWHWHLVYPNTGPKEVVDKDRRGELFYYMHQQLMARYNSERFSNNLSKVKIFNNFRDPIQEGYFPKILSSLSRRTYTGRIANTQLRDLERTELVSINELEIWRNRIFDAIDLGYIIDENHKQIPLDEKNGINILGDMVEASILSKNRKYYGNIHNMGHNLIAFAHDPEDRYLEDFGVMGDITTAMRDPIFYRWHGFIDSIFQNYKLTLPPYTKDQLSFNDVAVQNFQILLERSYKMGEKESFETHFNILYTCWQQSEINLAAALDFGSANKVTARFTHLYPTPFTYQITYDNKSGKVKTGTCRIFMCPKHDERGTKLKFNEQRLLAIEMDKFIINMQPGLHMYERKSTSSSVTIPLKPVGEEFRPSDPEELKKYLYCRCGWPEYMLVPKGKVEGMLFEMFVMISDYTDDAVEGTFTQEACDDNSSFCGLKDQLYPDKRAMGFPFDRPGAHPEQFLTNFVKSYDNMKLQEVTVYFEDKTV